MTSEEQFCHQMLAKLRMDYERAAKPYVDRLARIKSMEIPPIFVMCPPMSGEELGRLRASQPRDVTVFVGDVLAPVFAQDCGQIPTQQRSAPADGAVP